MARRSFQPLTLREQQCRKVARGKAYRKWACAWRRRALIGAAGLLPLLAAAVGVWEWRSQGVSRSVAAAQAQAYAASVTLGFSLHSTLLEGQRRTPVAEVERVLALRRGTPIFAVSLDELRHRLESIPTVKRAYVQRELPGTLRIRLEEREPVAVWQKGGKLALIDDGGAVMSDLSLADYPALPLVLGEGAPSHVAEALALLDAEPSLKAKVTALVRVGDRRWNVRFAGSGLELKLPEEDAMTAWQRFSRLNRERHFMLMPLKTVDMRQPGRLYLRFTREAQRANAPSKET
ncbi:MAG: FtsQ-type POTRA domain-containing protein [Alphaproteobacteria bacterium]|nr:FtsQ-type POTRA domain-containing protein [Alphaproteobacteria bacterium]